MGGKLGVYAVNNHDELADGFSVTGELTSNSIGQAMKARGTHVYVIGAHVEALLVVKHRGDHRHFLSLSLSLYL